MIDEKEINIKLGKNVKILPKIIKKCNDLVKEIRDYQEYTVLAKHIRI